MFNDNLPIIVSALFRTPSASSPNFQLKQDGGGIINWTCYGSGTFNGRYNQSNQTALFQIGKGTTPPTINDYAVETPFSLSPMNARTLMAHPTLYSAGVGKTNQAGAVGTSLESGDVTELVKFVLWRENISPFADKFIPLSRDTFPAKPIVIGDTVNIDYEVNF